MTPDLLRNVAVFVEVAKAQSFSKASIALGVPKSTVSRRVAELEREAGLRLFTRSTQKVALTEEGHQYFQACRRMIQDAEIAYDELQSACHQPRGGLRVSASVDFGSRLVAGLPAFCRRYPKLHVEFEFTTRRVDPMNDSCDVAIHIGVPSDSNLTARKLADVEVHLFAAPAYLELAGMPEAPADLASHECLLEGKIHRVGIQNIWTLTNGRDEADVEVHGSLSMNSVGMIRRLAGEGAGIALLPDSLCVDDLHSGRLTRVLHDWRAPSLPIYALTASRVIPAKTQVFLEFVRNAIDT